MKRTLRCPKCDHDRLLYVAQVADQTELVQDGSFAVGVARLVRIPRPGPIGGSIGQSFGELEAGVCRRCGYVELYVKDPDSIPIDGVHVREMGG